MPNLYFIFHEGDLLLKKQADGSYTIPQGEEPPVTMPTENVGADRVSARLAADNAVAFNIPDPAPDIPSYEMCALRQTYYKLPTNLYLLAGKCRELLHFHANNQYCSRCGHRMEMEENSISRRCPQCGREAWPQVSPAVIVLVHKGKDEVLLVHAHNFRGPFYGLVAGFVETGETLEEAVHREVFEETGLKISNLRYFGSQPWPYPSGIMVGFNADYVSGQIHLQASELASGGWFSRDNLPPIPEKLSIARRLIDHWLDNNP